MRIVLTGAGGSLGRVLVTKLREAGHEVTAWSRTLEPSAGVEVRAVELEDRAAIDRGLDEADPEAVMHLAAIAWAEAARRDPERARTINSQATARVAAWCNRRLRRLLYTSTDMVFDGAGRWYEEDDEPLPATVYGQTKLAGEAAVLSASRGLVARLALLYGRTSGQRIGFFDQAFDRFKRGEPQYFFDDEYRTPLLYEDAAGILISLLVSDVQGVIHVGGRDRLSRFELMRRVAMKSGFAESLVRAGKLADAEFSEPRPADLSLDTTRLQMMFPWLQRRPPDEVVA